MFTDYYHHGLEITFVQREKLMGLTWKDSTGDRTQDLSSQGMCSTTELYYPAGLMQGLVSYSSCACVSDVLTERGEYFLQNNHVLVGMLAAGTQQLGGFTSVFLHN